MTFQEAIETLEKEEALKDAVDLFCNQVLLKGFNNSAEDINKLIQSIKIVDITETIYIAARTLLDALQALVHNNMSVSTIDDIMAYMRSRSA